MTTVLSGNPGWAYVEACLSIMRCVRCSRQELIEWWIHEHDNRRRWKLDEHFPPGKDLKEAFQAKLTELKQKELSNESI